MLAQVVLQILLRRQRIDIVRLRGRHDLLLELLRILRVELGAGVAPRLTVTTRLGTLGWVARLILISIHSHGACDLIS